MRTAEIFDLSSRVAIVTGAGSGLGSAFAAVLAENGADVSLLDIDLDSAERVSESLIRQGGKTLAHRLDVADLDAQEALIDQIATQKGQLDILFLNAGISAGPGHFVEAGHVTNLDRSLWERVVHINLTSIMFGIKAAAKHMKRQKSGRIVVTASVAGLKGDDKVGYAYAASKAGVVNIVRQAALDLASYGICVNGIAPGPFMTNIGGGRLRDPATAKVFIDDIPLGRIADPVEIKGLALLLASKASSYITGITVPIDGGMTAG